MSDQESRVQVVKKKLSLDFGTDGTVRTIYSDDVSQFAEKIGGEISTVCRASNVEWETQEVTTNARFPAPNKGWAVRSAHDPKLALRIKSHFNPFGMLGGDRYNDEIVCSTDESLVVALFSSREKAIEWEVKFFFQLLPPNRKTT